MKKAEIDAFNADRYDGEPFDPRYVTADRVIGHETIRIPADRELTGHGRLINMGGGVQFREIDRYFVKWTGLSYKDCTWEDAEDIADFDMKIAEFRRFDHVPAGEHKENPIPTNAARIEQWYSKSPTYKSDNTLREYQVIGLNWLIKNYCQGRNSILADEMGLGKTVQAVVFLEHLRAAQNIRGPFLVLVPLSTLFFWRQCAESWTVRRRPPPPAW
jgi:SNF2 family DNA or RNA helicase